MPEDPLNYVPQSRFVQVVPRRLTLHFWIAGLTVALLSTFGIVAQNVCQRLAGQIMLEGGPNAARDEFYVVDFPFMAGSLALCICLLSSIVSIVRSNASSPSGLALLSVAVHGAFWIALLSIVVGNSYEGFP